MKTFLYLFLALFQVSISLSQVRVDTDDGASFFGIVVGQDKESITIQRKDGFRQKFALNKIDDMTELDAEIITVDSLIITSHIFFMDKDSIYYHFGRRNKELGLSRAGIVEIKYDSEILKPKVSEIDTIGYSSFGFAVGTPGLFNVVYSYRFPRSISLGIEAGGTKDIYGLQLNMGFNLSRSHSFEHNFLLAFGHISQIRKLGFDFLGYEEFEQAWTYYGIFYNINLWGIQAELGLSAGIGDFDSPMPHLQFGYVYRFID